MHSTARPLVVCFGSVRADGVLTFVAKVGYVEWLTDPDLFVEVLMLCNGYTTVADIATTVTQPVRVVSRMLARAKEYGIVVEVELYHSVFHALSQNPTGFGTALSPRSLDRLHDSNLPWRSTAPLVSLGFNNVADRLGSLLAVRQTVRNFVEAMLTFDELSDLLCCSYSSTATPSAGDLRPIMPYVYLFKQVGDLKPGLYEYRWLSREIFLAPYQPSLAELRVAFPEEFLFDNSLCLLCFAADLNRMSKKYGNRGYRYAILEAGHAAQNVYLWGAETGNGILEYGGFLDEYLSKALDLQDGVEVLTTLFVGKPNSHLGTPMSSKSELEKLQALFLGPTKEVKRVDLVTFEGQTSHRAYATAEHARVSDGQLQTSWGSGRNLNEAKLKALVEAVERYYSGSIRVDRECSARDLDAEWLDPRVMAPLSDLQYALCPELEPFDPARTTQWVLGERLSTNGKIFVPIDLVYYPVRQDYIGRKLCCYATSSGVAAHVIKELAVQNGLLELIERDVFVRSWYAHEPQPKSFSVSVFGDSEIVDYVSEYQRAGVEVTFAVLGLNVAVVVCMMRKGGRRAKVAVGAGASLSNFADAARKAFFEAEASWLSAPQQKVSLKNITDPGHHLGFYQSAARQQSLLKWLASPILHELPPLSQGFDSYDPVVVQLFKSSSLQVVRVLEESLVPISFGYGLEHYLHPAFREALSGRSYSFPGLPHCLA